MPNVYDYNNESTQEFYKNVKEQNLSMQSLNQSININEKITLELILTADYKAFSIKGIKKALSFYQYAYNCIIKELENNKNAFNNINGLIRIGCGFIEYFSLENTVILEGKKYAQLDYTVTLKTNKNIDKFIKKINKDFEFRKNFD